MTANRTACLYIFATIFLVATGSACAAQQAPLERNNIITSDVSIPLEWYPALDAAVKDFFATEQPAAGCFTVSVEVGTETLRVNFFPKRGPGDENLRGGATSCGRAVSYDMAITGDVVRRSFWR